AAVGDDLDRDAARGVALREVRREEHAELGARLLDGGGDLALLERVRRREDLDRAVELLVLVEPGAEGARDGGDLRRADGLLGEERRTGPRLGAARERGREGDREGGGDEDERDGAGPAPERARDRKSTRLNSSHVKT